MRLAVDISVYHNGYHGDLNETFLVGKVDDESFRLVKTTYDSLMAAIAECACARVADGGHSA